MQSQEVDNCALERVVGGSHALVKSHALSRRVVVVVVSDVCIATADSDHALVAPYNHLLDLSANQIAVLALQLGYGHEGAKKLAKSLNAQALELLVQILLAVLFTSISCLPLTELAVDAHLGLLYLAVQFFDEDCAVAIALLPLLHHSNLQLRVPVQAIDNLINPNVLFKLLFFGVVRVH